LTCYFRHLEEVFQKAGISVTSENRREIGRVVQSVVKMEGKHCPDVWREVRKRIKENNAEFVQELKHAWGDRSRTEHKP